MTQVPISAAMSEYVSECEEILERVSVTLSEVEKGAPVEEKIDALYRDFHTLKGTSQLFGLKEIGQLAHALEASFGPIRKFKTQISPPLIDSIYKCLDVISRMIQTVKEGGTQLSEFNRDLLNVLPGLVTAASAQFGGEFSVKKSSWVGNEAYSREATASAKPETPSPVQPSFEPSLAEPTVPPQEEKIMKSTPPEEKDANKIPVVPADPAVFAESTIRVQVELLDRLMNLAGELVLVRNQVLQYLTKNDDLEFLNLSQTLDIVTSDIQSEVMKTRMQPIGNLVSKFQRLIRDLAKDLG